VSASSELVRRSDEEVRPPRERLRIGFLVHVMQVAGAEMLVRDLITGLRDEVHPTVFCLDAIGRLGEELQANGVDVVCLERRPGIDHRVSGRLASEIRARGIELVHAHQYTPFFYAALAKARLRGRLRLMLTEHGRHFPDHVSAARRWGNRLALSRLADHVSACSEFSGRALAAVDGFARSPVEIIANGIDLSRFPVEVDRAAVLSGLALDPSRRYVVNVARFHPVKDHHTLLQAFPAIAAAHADTDLLLVGDGPLRPELERATEALGLTSRVHFCGVRTNIPEILAACDLFVLSSLSEAASLTLLEAMASRTAVVVTAVGGNPEIVEQGVTGRLVARQDPAALAAAVTELLADREGAAAIARRARRHVERHYRLESTIAAYAERYALLCDGRAPS